jgi:hypothetical protein
MLSIAGGYFVAELSRGIQPGWATWGDRMTSFENPSVGDGFLVASQLDSVLYRWTSIAVFPESDRESFEAFKEFEAQAGFVGRNEPSSKMLLEAQSGIRSSFRGSFGPIVGVWSWNWSTTERQSLNLGFPPSGFVRVLGVPLAYKPVLPGFFLGWLVSYGLLQAVLAIASRCLRVVKRFLARYRTQPGHCRGCGYDLAGIALDVCPKCGAVHA